MVFAILECLILFSFVCTLAVGNTPSAILRKNFAVLTNIIAADLYEVTNTLFAEGLIPLEALNHVLTATGTSDLKKSGYIMFILQGLLESSLNANQSLIHTCHVLRSLQNPMLCDIATSMLSQLGKHAYVYMPQSQYKLNTLDHSENQACTAPHDAVQLYAKAIKNLYKYDCIIDTNDWPPKLGHNFFGRLVLQEKQVIADEASQWYVLRGKDDEICNMSSSKPVTLETVFQPKGPLSLRVVIDGPPGVGKTTLCRKILNLWSNGALGNQQYDLVLYCPLRNSKIAAAKTLTDLFENERYEVPMVAKDLKMRNGKGLLVIFDGWDELSVQLRHSSLATSIFHRKQLDQCSVIITSRTYASSSISRMSSLSRYVQILGFSDEEISAVIIHTIQKNARLAKKLIDENKAHSKYAKYKARFSTTESDKYSLQAVELINELNVRSDIRSLCYIPLICSMVILVHSKEGKLPKTLTELYENFILQTIKRHVSKSEIFDPYSFGSLSSIPSEIEKLLQEMCKMAYTSLTDKNMTFASHQLQESVANAFQKGCLGLITTFREYDEEKHQFLHLTIQEFLAAWWISKYETAEEVFDHHFDHDHFKMCLRFVAGLTHLQNDIYKKYFNMKFDLQCNRVPLLGFESSCFSYFYQNPEIRWTLLNMLHVDNLHNISDYPVLLFHLLYESQNPRLCQVLAESIDNQSLCLRNELPLFDYLCLGYFLSNTSWNHLHQCWKYNREALPVFTSELMSTQCKILEVFLYETTAELITEFVRQTVICNIQECYCRIIHGDFDSHFLLLQLFKHPQLKIIHVTVYTSTLLPGSSKKDSDELEKCIEVNSNLLEVKICGCYFEITSIIKGMIKNKKVNSLSLNYQSDNFPAIPSKAMEKILGSNTSQILSSSIEQLLSKNKTLRAVSLCIPKELPLSLNIMNVKTPLVALELGQNIPLMLSLLEHIKKLQCLVLPQSHPPHLLFHFHPNLQALTIPLVSDIIAIELFTILQTNTTLVALKVEIMVAKVISSRMCNSLEIMLGNNNTLRYLVIDTKSWQNFEVPDCLLPHLTAGLQCNDTLNQLSVPILLSTDNAVQNLTTVISESKKLVDIQLDFEISQSYRSCSLFYKQALLAVINLLQSHTTIRMIRTQYNSKRDDKYTSQDIPWEEIVQRFYEATFLHNSIEYIEFSNFCAMPTPMFRALSDQRTAFMDRCKKERPFRPPPKMSFHFQ